MSKSSKKRLFEDMLDDIAKPKSQLHANTHAESETFTKTSQQTIEHAITKVHNEVKVDEVKEMEAQEETKTEVKLETKEEPQQEADKEIKTKVKVNTKKDKDPASILFDRIGKKKEKIEDQRIRRTYWLTKQEIEMVDELAELTGMDKYEVVSLAIQSMHTRAKQK